MPAFFSLSISLLYEILFSRAAAFILMFQSARKFPFFFYGPEMRGVLRAIALLLPRAPFCFFASENLLPKA